MWALRVIILASLFSPSFLLSFTFFTSLPPSCFGREKFVEVDLKPVCKHCYERLPDDMKRRLAKRERDSKEKKKKLLIPMCLWSFLSSFFFLPLFLFWSVSFGLIFCLILCYFCHQVSEPGPCCSISQLYFNLIKSWTELVQYAS